MTAEEITKIIAKAIEARESEDFDALVESLASQGWANPTLEAQNRWQGHDNRIVYGTYAEARRNLLECGHEHPDEDDDETEEVNLFATLSSAGEVGTGAPLAYVGVDGYFTLIREGATIEEIENAATDCLPDSGEAEDES